jgi:hypothetical protein
LAISTDRFFAVCYPLIYRAKFTEKSTKITIAVCWFAGLIETIPIFGWNSGSLVDRCDPRAAMDFNFVIFSNVVVSCIPTCIIVILYIMIFRTIIQQVSSYVTEILFMTLNFVIVAEQKTLNNDHC